MIRLLSGVAKLPGTAKKMVSYVHPADFTYEQLKIAWPKFIKGPRPSDEELRAIHRRFKIEKLINNSPEFINSEKAARDKLVSKVVSSGKFLKKFRESRLEHFDNTANFRANEYFKKNLSNEIID